MAPLAAQCRDVTIKRSGDQDGAVDQQGRLEVGEGGSAGLDRRVGRDVDQQEGQSGGGRGSADLKKRVAVQQGGLLTSMGFIFDSFKKMRGREDLFMLRECKNVLPCGVSNPGRGGESAES